MKRFFIGMFALVLQPCVDASISPLLSVQPKVQPSSVLERTLKKITFDISVVTPEGLAGSSQGRRAIHYEFCIPRDAQHLTEVLAIDPTITYHRHSRGRIGCKPNQYLCLGGTPSPRWREILLSLARLDYVERIDEFFGE